MLTINDQHIGETVYRTRGTVVLECTETTKRTTIKDASHVDVTYTPGFYVFEVGRGGYLELDSLNRAPYTTLAEAQEAADKAQQARDEEKKRRAEKNRARRSAIQQKREAAQRKREEGWKSRAGEPITIPQVQFIMDLLAQGRKADGPTEESEVEKMTRGEASAYIDALRKSR